MLVVVVGSDRRCRGGCYCYFDEDADDGDTSVDISAANVVATNVITIASWSQSVLRTLWLLVRL